MVPVKIERMIYMDVRQVYEQWLRDFAQDEDTVKDLQAIAGVTRVRVIK